MRATEGAIEACTIDADTMEPAFQIVGEEGTKPIGLCGSGIIDVISELFRCGIIDPKGKFVRDGKRIKRDAYGMGSYVLAFEASTSTNSLHGTVENPIVLPPVFSSCCLALCCKKPDQTVRFSLMY